MTLCHSVPTYWACLCLEGELQTRLQSYFIFSPMLLTSSRLHTAERPFSQPPNSHVETSLQALIHWQTNPHPPPWENHRPWLGSSSWGVSIWQCLPCHREGHWKEPFITWGIWAVPGPSWRRGSSRPPGCLHDASAQTGRGRRNCCWTRTLS